MPPRPFMTDPVLGPLTDDRLTRDFRVYQRLHGHRFSADDMVTAWVAARTCPEARRVCDLGCGLGSVLLHLAWSMPAATLVGIEAQAQSFELLTRNVARNAVGDRVHVHHGDLRDEDSIRFAAPYGPFPLITGTPPYFPPDTARDADDEQRAFARIEYRGGVEAYIATAERLLSADGSFVLCGDHEADSRVLRAAADARLAVVARLDVFPRVGQPPLFSVWTLARPGHAPAGARSVTSITLRDEHGEQTADALALRAFSGL